MIFDIDKQTIRDLELFSDTRNGNSIFSFFNRTITTGGQDILYEMLENPVSDLEFLQQRKEEINFFFLHEVQLKLVKRQLDFIEYYLRLQRSPLRNNLIDAAVNALSNKIKLSGDYYTISEGIYYIVRLLIDLQEFTKKPRRL